MSRSWSHPYQPDAKYQKRVAYFSMEFGIDQALKIYSGGLGYLAGSHMRAAYQLKQNMIGIGMLWKYGYYDQDRDSDSKMVAKFHTKRYSYLEDTGIKVKVTIHNHPVWVKAWYLAPETFGTVPMYLLSTDMDENDYLARSIMNKLYHPNDATRIAQSIVLGVGGAKLSEELGGVDIHHLNEAHSLPAAFYLLKKYHHVDAVKERLVFTTHTPVKAGNAVRSIHLLNEMTFFAGVSLDRVREVTQMHGDDFEYTPSALRLAKISNGVSQLHGSVANKMWENYEDTSDIIAITNSQDEVYWKDAPLYDALHNKDDESLVKRKKELKKELFKVVADQTGNLFDPDVLTIVWARRFAGYKRADLIYRDMKRFISLISNKTMPVQMIWAGKPYPEDYGAINKFNEIEGITRSHKNMAILTGYELNLSGILKGGSDIWLNTPRRPKEASGTSGMTAAMKGTLNLSTNDGWIPEFAKDGVNCFVIPEADLNAPIEDQDNHDHAELMRMLEEVIVPTYYDSPEDWNNIVKNSMKDIIPFFDSKRMADEYYMKLFNVEVFNTVS